MPRAWLGPARRAWLGPAPRGWLAWAAGLGRGPARPGNEARATAAAGPVSSPSESPARRGAADTRAGSRPSPLDLVGYVHSPSYSPPSAYRFERRFHKETTPISIIRDFWTSRLHVASSGVSRRDRLKPAGPSQAQVAVGHGKHVRI